MRKEGGIQLPLSKEALKVRAALENPVYYWRTIPAIANETELPVQQVDKALNDLSNQGDQVVHTRRKRHGDIFTMRERYRKEEPLINRVLSIVAGRIK